MDHQLLCMYGHGGIFLLCIGTSIMFLRWLISSWFFSYKRYSACLFLHKASLYACVLLRLRLLWLIFCCCFRAWQTLVPPWMVELAALQSLKTDSPGPLLMLCTALWDRPEKFRAKVRYFGNGPRKLLLVASHFCVFVFVLSLVFSSIPWKVSPQPLLLALKKKRCRWRFRPNFCPF